MKQFGLSSAITNFTLVIATAVTGYLAEVSWHLPFLVYLLPLISILLVGHLKTTQPEAAVSSSQKDDSEAEDSSIDIGGGKYGIHIRHLIPVNGFLRDNYLYCSSGDFQSAFLNGKTSFFQR